MLAALAFTLTGCTFIGLSTPEEQCACFTDGLLESEPIQDLIDGDNKWMGLILGATKAEEIEGIFEDIPHEYCYARQEESGSHMVCNDIPEKYFKNIGGYIFVHLTEFNCQGFYITWELHTIKKIVFSCGDCIKVEQLFSQINEPSYISAWPAGLHDSELLTTLFYPQRGLSVGLETLDPLDPQLTQTTTVSYFELTLPIPDNKRSTLKEIISVSDYECLQEWVGYGDIVDLYYSEESNPNCPHRRN